MATRLPDRSLSPSHPAPPGGGIRGWRRNAVLVALGTAVLALVFAVSRGWGGPAAWSQLGTTDAHALAFSRPGSDALLFGHHYGLLSSNDGGRTRARLPLARDAMAFATAPDRSIVLAGHDAFAASRDGGVSWASIATDLPSFDIHSLARSLRDPATLWVSIAEGGVFVSHDTGATFSRVSDAQVEFLTAITTEGLDVLLGIDRMGLARSTDDGVTWTPVGAAPAAPVTALAATPDGRVVLAGATDGLYRSDDGGASWSHVFAGQPVLAVAVDSGASEIALVTGNTSFYRSHDGGLTWPGPS